MEDESFQLILVMATGAATFLFSMGYWWSSSPKRRHGIDLPTTYRRVVVTKPARNLTQVIMDVEEIPTPQKLKSGQVLVQVCAVAINPSDYNEWKTKAGPTGHEGVGVVVASGGGFWANRLVGQEVGIFRKQGGICAEYLVCSALEEVFSLHKLRSNAGEKYELADAASWFINPFTALSILEVTARKHNSNVLIHTAAASQVGQMLNKLAKSRNMTIVNVVRRSEQVELLQKEPLNCKYVVCTADADWKEQLQDLVRKLKIQVAFDAVGGDMTGTLVSVLPSRRGTCYVYGVLAGDAVNNVNAIDLIYRQKKVLGYSFGNNWLTLGGPIAALWRIWRGLSSTVQVGSGGLAESQFVDCTLNGLHEQFCDLQQNGFTGRKLRVRMDHMSSKTNK